MKTERKEINWKEKTADDDDVRLDQVRDVRLKATEEEKKSKNAIATVTGERERETPDINMRENVAIIYLNFVLESKRS